MEATPTNIPANTPAVTDIFSLIARLKTLTGSSDDQFRALRKIMGDGFTVRMEEVHDVTKKARVIISNRRNSANYKKLLTQQCNGLVLEYPSWKVLAVPAAAFTPQFKIKQLPPLDTYQVYEIHDGTVVTLYWWDEEWLMSSTNGFDIGHYTWTSDKSYMELFRETAAKVGFSLDNLDKKYSYTIGFRHEELHPLKTDPAAMWLVQMCDVTAINDAPGATLDAFMSATIIEGLPRQKAVKLTLKEAVEAKNAALEQYRKDKTINYGYILRGKFEQHGELSNIVLESTLLTQVRQLVYNLPKSGSGSGLVPSTPRERVAYMTMKAYLGIKTHRIFEELFPHLAQRYPAYKSVFDKVTGKVFNALKSKHVLANLKFNATKRPVNADGDRAELLASAVFSVAYLFAERIKNHVHVKPTDINSIKIVRDLIVDIRNLDVFFEKLIIPKLI